MTPSTLLRFAVRAMAGIALAASGIYVLVYLERWEWNRAVITGILFLATLSVISTSAILGAIRRLSQRVENLERHASTTTDVANTLRRANAQRATRHFDWLREPPDRLSVFVPILLGAGALLSAVAYVIERVAGAVGGPTVDRRTAELLAQDLPLGAPVAIDRPDLPAATTPRPTRGIARTAIVGAGLVVFVAGATWVLREATQTRPDPRSLPGRTEIELAVAQRRTDREPVDVAASMWSVCRNRVAPDVDLVEVRAGAGESAVLVLDRTVGPHARHRLHGCLEDAVLERVQADVVGFVQTG